MLRTRVLCFLAAAILAVAGDTGVPPRANANEYASHQTVDSATMAASIVPAEQIRKIFSPAIAKEYVVVECAFFQADGHSVDVDRFGFGLKTGPDSVAHAEQPRDVAAPWPERNSPMNRGPQTVSETGVYVEHSSTPVYGRQTNVGAWEGVGVTNDDRNAPPPKAPPDTRAMENKLRERALPEGSTRDTVAGYLYFPRYAKKHKAIRRN